MKHSPRTHLGCRFACSGLNLLPGGSIPGSLNVGLRSPSPLGRFFGCASSAAAAPAVTSPLAILASVTAAGLPALSTAAAVELPPEPVLFGVSWLPPAACIRLCWPSTGVKSFAAGDTNGVAGFGTATVDAAAASFADALPPLILAADGHTGLRRFCAACGCAAVMLLGWLRSFVRRTPAAAVGLLTASIPSSSEG